LQNIKLLIIAFLLIVFSLFFLASPNVINAAKSIFSIQVGTFSKEASADRAFDLLQELLNEKKLDNLRIEKAGKYYIVRIGKFEKRDHADKFLGTIKAKLAPAIAASKLSPAIVMKVYFNKEKFHKLYKTPLSNGIPATKEKPISVTPTKKIKPPVVSKTLDKNVKKTAPVSKKYKLMEISGLVQKENYKGALGIIKSELGKNPESPALNGWYGTVLLRIDQPAKAYKYFKKAAELSPDVPDYHNGTGYCLLFLKRFDNAVDEFNKSITIDPLNVDALTGLGTAYAKTGNKEKARNIYKKLIGLDSETAGKLLRIIERET